MGANGSDMIACPVADGGWITSARQSGGKEFQFAARVELRIGKSQS